jgi:uncharacterized protein
MRMMAELLQRNRAPSEVMAMIAAEDAKGGPYRACPCGSGKKFRFCHGDKAPASPFTGVRPDLAGAREGRGAPASAQEASE